MQPLALMPCATAAAVHTVFSDLDDTVTTDGRLTAEAYAALEQLQAAGIRVILTTGRPAGWCDHIARMWPVDGVIGENGAFYFWYDHRMRRLCARHQLQQDERRAQAAKLSAVGARILREVPGCALASDQFCRIYDLAIDFREDVAPLPDSAIDRIVALMRSAGMTAKVSSIHVNGWFGSYDKLTMAHTMMRERYGLDLDAERARCLFVGDSPNDAPMFAYLPNAVGVANVVQFSGRMAHFPAWIAAASCGAGFAEVARILIAARA
jgi:HAD superfamily hydrolase (TIGR01484 family)